MKGDRFQICYSCESPDRRSLPDASKHGLTVASPRSATSFTQFTRTYPGLVKTHTDLGRNSELCPFQKSPFQKSRFRKSLFLARFSCDVVQLARPLANGMRDRRSPALLVQMLRAFSQSGLARNEQFETENSAPGLISQCL